MYRVVKEIAHGRKDQRFLWKPSFPWQQAVTLQRVHMLSWSMQSKHLFLTVYHHTPAYWLRLNHALTKPEVSTDFACALACILYLYIHAKYSH